MEESEKIQIESRLGGSSAVTSFLIKGLLFIVLLEAFLGGGGRLFDFGTLSVRMYLFVFSLVLSIGVFFVYRRGVKQQLVFLLLAHSVIIIFSAIVGLLEGATLGFVFNDIKPLLSFYSIFFFYLTIHSDAEVSLVKRMLIVCAVILAISYLTIFALINLKLIPFAVVYSRFSETEEFFFRGNFAFFYKGFLYMGVGLFFIAERWRRIDRILIVLVVIALILTFTRGFLVSLVLTYLFYLLVIRKRAVKLIIFFAVLMLIGTAVWSFVSRDHKIDRKQSDTSRVVQIQEVVSRITPLSVFVGHGYGVGVPSRREHMEIAYLEIFHKQGVVGLVFWLGVFVYAWRMFTRVSRAGRQREATPFILAVVYIAIQSLTNPFVNNPIGIVMIALSLVCLHVIDDEARQQRIVDSLE